MLVKHLAFALILVAGPALAEEAPKPTAPESPKPVLTADEGRKLYELGVKTGVAQGVVQAAQSDMKPILDKLQPVKP